MLQIMKKQQIKRVEDIMLALKAAGWEKSETEVPRNLIAAIFTCHEKVEWVSYIQTMETRLFDVDTNDLRMLVFYLTEKIMPY